MCTFLLECDVYSRITLCTFLLGCDMYSRITLCTFLLGCDVYRRITLCTFLLGFDVYSRITLCTFLLGCDVYSSADWVRGWVGRWEGKMPGNDLNPESPNFTFYHYVIRFPWSYQAPLEYRRINKVIEIKSRRILILYLLFYFYNIVPRQEEITLQFCQYFRIYRVIQYHPTLEVILFLCTFLKNIAVEIKEKYIFYLLINSLYLVFL
jgi:hypothetical protein